MDTKPGEVLLPATRYLPRCDHDRPKLHAELQRLGKDGWWNVVIELGCEECGKPYRQELEYGVDGIGHGYLPQNE